MHLEIRTIVTDTSTTKKEAILSSVISDLSKGDPEMINSFAHAHALLLRADLRLDKCRRHRNERELHVGEVPLDHAHAAYTEIVEGAIDDASLASQLTPSERKVWRILASAHEANGNIVEAINAVRKLGIVDPSFATKAKKEIERLRRFL